MRRLERPWPVEVTVEGLNLERFVRQAGERGITLNGLKRKGSRRMFALVRENDIPALQELAIQGGWQLKMGNRRGAGKAADWLHRRWLLAAMILLAGAVLVVGSQVMWQVEIIGAGTYEADVRQAVLEMGIGPPMLRSQIDLGALRESLEWRYPRIAWFECGWRGGTLVVRAVEGVLPRQEGTSDICDVVATRDAIVSQVVTRAGTAVVQPGDFVRKGDMLIKGEERTSNGEVKAVSAEGNVIGRVWEGASVQMSCAEVQTTYTGNEQNVWTVRTPWFDLWKLPQCDYDCYDISVSEQDICGTFLPMKLYTETRLEASQTLVKRDLEQVRAEAEEAALRKLHEKITDQESLIDIWGNCSMIDAENVLSLAIGEMLVEIGIKRPPSDMAAPD